MEHIDFLGLAGLIVGFGALLIAIYGIRDVREQVEDLVTLERNRVYARVLHKMRRRFVQPIGDVDREESLSDMHEFIVLARALDPKQTVDSAQEFASKESLASAQEMVKRGLTNWRDDIDEHNVIEILKEWQNDKNAAALRKIFGRSPLSELTKDLMS